MKFIQHFFVYYFWSFTLFAQRSDEVLATANSQKFTVSRSCRRKRARLLKICRKQSAKCANRFAWTANCRNFVWNRSSSAKNNGWKTDRNWSYEQSCRADRKGNSSHLRCEPRKHRRQNNRRSSPANRRFSAPRTRTESVCGISLQDWKKNTKSRSAKM